MGGRWRRRGHGRHREPEGQKLETAGDCGGSENQKLAEPVSSGVCCAEFTCCLGQAPFIK